MQNNDFAVRKQTEIAGRLTVISPSTIDLSHHPSPNESALSTSCFDNEIPSFIEPALNNLYGSLYSSMPHFRVYGGLENANTFVARRGKDIEAIFFFRCENREVRVLNEGMKIEASAVKVFADYIFARFKEIDVISFNAVESTINKLSFPYHQSICTNDSVVSLPNTPESYLSSLGKSTRKNIRQYLSRIKRDYPSFQYQIYIAQEAEERFIRGIIEFNRIRFANKNKVSAITSEEEDRIVKMVHECGMIGVATIEGKLCAGSITYCFGDHYHSRLRTCDPAFDDYRLGLICGYLMIDECIRRHGKTFHFMSGGEAQKTLLQGRHHDQAHVTVYRSNMAVLRHADVIFKRTCQDMMRQFKLRLLAGAKEDGKVMKGLRTTLFNLRKLRTYFSRHA